MKTLYDANSIRVLDDQETIDRMPWLKAETLASEYSLPLEFAERLLRACSLSGWPVELAVRRYLDGDRTITVPPEMVEAHRHLAVIAARGY